ncbi:MAG: CpaE family protein [Agromyces sp.]
MTRVFVSVTAGATELAHDVDRWGHVVIGVGHPGSIEAFPPGTELCLIDTPVLSSHPDLVSACDAVGVRLVALIESIEEQRYLRGQGIEAVLRSTIADTLPEVLAGAMRSATRAPGARGRIVTVWGAPGAPGASTLAINLAAECLAAKQLDPERICLIDLDCWAPSLAAILGQHPDVPGVAAAARLAERNELTEAELARLSVSGPAQSWLLGGLMALDRWPELSSERVHVLLNVTAALFDLVIIDLGSHHRGDERDFSDPFAPRRTAAAEAALSRASLNIGVGAADPVGLARLIRAWPAWAGPAGSERRLVVNRVRGSVLGMQPATQIRRTCEDFLDVTPDAMLPDDPRAADSALRLARPLCEVSPKSALRLGIAEFAARTVN